MTINSSSLSNSSYYTIVDFPQDGKTYGKYYATNPKKAAIKAFNELIKFIDADLEKEGKFIVFVIKNIGGNNKEYKYIGNRIKLENPVLNKKNGKEITYLYKNVVSNYNIKLNKI
jgi:hypothetical protein